jgi:hypothetical protein
LGFKPARKTKTSICSECICEINKASGQSLRVALVTRAAKSCRFQKIYMLREKRITFQVDTPARCTRRRLALLIAWWVEQGGRSDARHTPLMPVWRINYLRILNIKTAEDLVTLF